ncbi:alpha/beta fold hydrolase [Flavobacterium subsaxonicum]|uniref:Arylesterase n=1 Tax=Flavobacterium subsaxonicum WB 4.1-42 = DSM 21790 TaxID=1121898 RepID=A0A0A2MT18_9FLAO|nr:alpha/beta hydrolase [Flavobacterium subsaxonicum]KGO94618.1 arylesterase [Flavobacterium subsaxonicum WB 4.1-42 = DSM 21790]
MPFITTNSVSLSGSSEEVNIFYQDIGRGRPVVLIHGWPLNYQMWEYQLNELPKHNIRVIAYDRRGFGLSSRPWEGYDYDTFAQDLNLVLEELNLTDVTLVGFSMGGGEVARYLAKYNTAGRVTKAALISAVTPFLLKTDDNPTGLPQEMFDAMQEQIEDDRPKFLAAFGKMFYGVHLFSKPASQEILDHDAALALNSAGYSTIKAMKAWSTTDFRADLDSIKIPTLVIHGKADETVPIDASAEETVKHIPHAEYLVYDDAPHGLYYTHKNRFNEDIIRFINT